MQIDPVTSLINDVTYVPSPNFNQRPADTDIDLLVVHGISLPPGEFGGDCVEKLFCNTLDHSSHPSFSDLEGLEVSAHVFIRRDGEIIQFVPFNERAWHAGQSIFDGRENCNDYSIGVEVEGADNISYTINQYQQLALLSTCLMRHYPGINSDRIKGHCHVAPGRKTDPGPAFDWVLFQSLLEKGI